ncbi:unnamed protein product [Orchesella dallaii]|uniref:F-box domain-containing protein n=1 Tax=Orchesella dallaii TaxID=48710 RepID=A0ABP1RZJ1_9HEXA
MDLERVAPQLPEDILPLEVWGLILDRLRSPSDLINCNQTCKAWAKLLELRKTTFLMPQVFPLLHNYLGPTKKANEEGETEDNLIVINYSVYQEKVAEREYAKLNTVLQMRLVSHSWKESVDTYYQDHDAINDIDFMTQDEEEDLPSKIPFRPYTFGIDNVAKLESWVSKDFPPDCNPFITRYVVFEDNSRRLRYEYVDPDDGEHGADLERLQRQLRTSFKTLLESFGSQIWTVRLYLSRSGSSRIELYRLVRSYLILMPNLKAIHIVGPSDELAENGSSFEELLRQKPMPGLEHLKILGMSPISFPTSIGILSQNPKLCKLSVDNHFQEIVPLNSLRGIELPELEQLALAPDSKVDLSHVQNLVWQNLKGLKLTVDGKQLKDVFGAVSASSFSSSLERFILEVWNGHGHFEYDTEVEYLERQLAQPEWYLEEAEQQLEFEQPEWQWEQAEHMEDLTAVVEQLERLGLGAGAVQLEQQLGRLEAGAEQPEQQLELRKLKKIQLTIDIPFELETIDFLLGCPYLQEIGLDIKISSKSKEDNTSNSVIQFKSCIASMQDSNIWQLLPMLKRLEIKVTGIEGFIRRGRTLYPQTTYLFTRGKNGKITSS